MPKQTRFSTFVLLLQPSMKPFDHGTSMEYMIPVRNDHSVFEAYPSDPPKVWIHIENKVFYILSGLKL